MKTEKEIRSDSGKYNQATIGKQLVYEEFNTAYNHHIIIEAFKSGRAKDIADCKKENEKPCIVIGSGPSLDYSIKFLKDWKGGIICTTSHARTLMKFGIEPTYILVLDPFCSWEEIEGVDWELTNTILITHPGASNCLIKNWPNEMLMYIENMGRSDTFYATTQKRMFSWKNEETRNAVFNYYIRTEIVIFACSPPMQLFVAGLVGYGKIFLCGVDFGFNKEKDRFTDYSFDKEGNWIENAHPYKPSDADIEGLNGVITHDVHLYYKKNFLSAWRLSHQTIYTTDHGLITEIPYLDIEEVVERQGDFPKQENEFIDEVTDKYLASVGAFVIVTEKSGVSFVESKDPIVELRQFMDGLNRTYVCPECKTKYTLKPGTTKIDYRCNCEKGILEQACPVNITANLERIAKLIGIEDMKKIEPRGMNEKEMGTSKKKKKSRQKRKAKK